MNRDYVQIFYDISMSIGVHTNLKEMAKEALAKYLRKLNCIAGTIERFHRDSFLQSEFSTIVETQGEIVIKMLSRKFVQIF